MPVQSHFILKTNHISVTCIEGLTHEVSKGI